MGNAQQGQLVSAPKHCGLEWLTGWGCSHLLTPHGAVDAGSQLEPLLGVSAGTALHGLTVAGFPERVSQGMRNKLPVS